jgi:hypothetical protein
MVRSPSGVSRFPYPPAGTRKRGPKTGGKPAPAGPAGRARGRTRGKPAV